MFATTPRPVLLAGLIVGAQALAGLALATALVIKALSGPTAQLSAGKVFGEAGYFAVVAAGVVIVAVGLTRGRRWARSPAIVLQLLLLGVTWYMIGPSMRPAYGLPLGVVTVSVLVLLFTREARAWAWAGDDNPDGESAPGGTSAGGPGNPPSGG